MRAFGVFSAAAIAAAGAALDNLDNLDKLCLSRLSRLSRAAPIGILAVAIALVMNASLGAAYAAAAESGSGAIAAAITAAAARPSDLDARCGLAEAYLAAGSRIEAMGEFSFVMSRAAVASLARQRAAAGLFSLYRAAAEDHAKAGDEAGAQKWLAAAHAMTREMAGASARTPTTAQGIDSLAPPSPSYLATLIGVRRDLAANRAGPAIVALNGLSGPRSAAVLALRAHARFLAGDLARADQDLARAQSLAPSDPDVCRVTDQMLLARAPALMAAGRSAEALELLASIPVDRTSGRVLSLRARLHLATSDTAGALGDYEAAASRADATPFVHAELARLYLATGALDRLLERYPQAAPSDPRAWLSHARKLVARGETIGALAAYAKVLSLDPSIAAAWAEAGKLRLVQGDAARAVINLGEARKRGDEMVLSDLITALAIAGRAREAELEVEKALQASTRPGIPQLMDLERIAKARGLSGAARRLAAVLRPMPAPLAVAANLPAKPPATVTRPATARPLVTPPVVLPPVAKPPSPARSIVAPTAAPSAVAPPARPIVAPTAAPPAVAPPAPPRIVRATPPPPSISPPVIPIPPTPAPQTAPPNTHLDSGQSPHTTDTYLVASVMLLPRKIHSSDTLLKQFEFLCIKGDTIAARLLFRRAAPTLDAVDRAAWTAWFELEQRQMAWSEAVAVADLLAAKPGGAPLSAYFYARLAVIRANSPEAVSIAVVAAIKAVRLSPMEVAPRLLASEILWRAGRAGAALELLTPLLRTLPDGMARARVLAAYGTAALTLGLTEDAATQLSEAHRLAMTYADHRLADAVAYNLALAERRRGEPARALAVLDQSRRDDLPARLVRAAALIDLDRASEATAILEASASASPIATLNYGILLRQNGLPTDAVRVLSYLAEIWKGEALVHYHLAVAMEAAGTGPGARAEYLAAAEAERDTDLADIFRRQAARLLSSAPPG